MHFAVVSEWNLWQPQQRNWIKLLDQGRDRGRTMDTRGWSGIIHITIIIIIIIIPNPQPLPPLRNLQWRETNPSQLTPPSSPPATPPNTPPLSI